MTMKMSEDLYNKAIKRVLIIIAKTNLLVVLVFNKCFLFVGIILLATGKLTK